MVMVNEPILEEADERFDYIAAIQKRYGAIDRLRLVNPAADFDRNSDFNEVQAFGRWISGQTELLAELKGFLAVHPDISLELEFIRWRDAFYLFTHFPRHADDSSPDVVQVGSTWTPFFAHEGLLLPLPSDLVGPAEYFPAAARSVTIAGEEGTYAVPWFLEGRILFYHRDALPDLTVLKSWDSFFAHAKQLSLNGAWHAPFVIPIARSWDLLHSFTPWLWEAGGDMVNGNQQAARATVGFLKKMRDAGVLDLPAKTNDEVGQQFLRGEYAFFITGPWFQKLIEMKGLTNEIGIALPPAGLHGAIPFIGGSHIAITRFARERGRFAAARELLTFIGSAASQGRYAAASGMLPANREALELFLADHPTWSVYREALLRGRSHPNLPEWAEWVEKDVTLNQLYHWWESLAQGQGIVALEEQWEGIERFLSRRRWQARVARFAPWGVAGLVIAASVAIVVLRHRWRGRYRALHLAFEDLQSRIERRSWDTPRFEEVTPDRFVIRSNGKCFFDGAEVRFDNARQAERLMATFIRQRALGQEEISSLWGFALFDWHPAKLRSDPHALFKTAVAKINAPLKQKLGIPFIMRIPKSRFWKLVPEFRFLSATSDVLRIDHHATTPEEIRELLRLDPYHFKVWDVAVKIGDHTTTFAAEWNVFQHFLSVEREGAERGLALLTDVSFPASEERDQTIAQLEQWLGLLKGWATPVVGRQSPRHRELVHQMERLHQHIVGLRARGSSWEEVWAEVTQAGTFTTFICQPVIDRLIHSAYAQRGEREDPRLVQLALVWVLGAPDNLKQFVQSQGEEEITRDLKRHIRRELDRLGNYLVTTA